MSDASPPCTLLTVREVATILRCSPQAIYLWCESGRLSHVRLGRLVRVTPDDVRQFIEAGRSTGALR
jgi:excisionase family DNA binding protein